MEACKAIRIIVEKGFKKGLIDQLSEIDNNRLFFLKNLKSKNENKNNEKDWLDKNLDNTNNGPNKAVIHYILQDVQNTSSNYTKEKLVYIFERNNSYQNNAKALSKS